MTLVGYGPKNYDAVLDELQLEQSHNTEIFPESTDRKVELTAGGSTNAWGTWAVVQDDTPIKLSGMGASNMHISTVNIEDLSVDDNRYMIEIAYGDDKTVVSRHRFVSGESKKLEAVTHVRIRAGHIPAGEEVYYRMMCEVAEATCEVSFRYHLHA